jgi:hypothetical protein
MPGLKCLYVTNVCLMLVNLQACVLRYGHLFEMINDAAQNACLFAVSRDIIHVPATQSYIIAWDVQTQHTHNIHSTGFLLAMYHSHVSQP